MSQNLKSFLEGLEPTFEDVFDWPDGIRLRGRSYLTRLEPPAEYVSSVRAVVTRNNDVLVVTNANISHILPGGRLEPGESHESALRRELIEETGWEVERIEPIGFLHYRHLTPKPPDYRYPYPDFVQRVFTATAERLTDLKQEDDWELRWVDLETAYNIELPGGSLAFLKHVSLQ